MIAPYGAWTSPLTADLVASGQVGLGQIALDGGDVYWVEARAAEAGRNVVVRRGADGRTADVTPAPFSARTRVHEYGGGAFAVADGVLCFSHFGDQQVYVQEGGAAPRSMTPAEPDRRFADFAFDRDRRRVVCVCEDHGAGGEPRNFLVALALDGSGSRRLAEGHDFYSNPRPSPDGDRLAWLTWEHPNMPWDGTRLWVAPLRGDGDLGAATCVAGGDSESICQPEWSPDGDLVFASDRSGWWNLYRWRLGDAGDSEVLWSRPADFAAAQWIFGQSTYAFDSASRLVCAWVERGIWRLGSLSLQPGGACTAYDLPFTDVSFVRAGGGKAVFRAAAPRQVAAVVCLDLAEEADAPRRRAGLKAGTAVRSTVDVLAAAPAPRVLRRSSEIEVGAGYVSQGEAIEFATAGGHTAHGFFYPPRNHDFEAPPAEKPPLLVMSHGGPTASTGSGLNLRIQYWTSRGIAVLDVNYRGSTGFGRAYREELKGQWGVADVDDCVHGARALVDAGRVDGARLAITGGSAGGYTTLCALTFRDVFKAGASYYGISDLEALAQDTHKFESHYEEGLVGPYPERRDLYRARSPIHFSERLSCPMIFFQGLDDRVVPPSQAERMVAALRAKGLPVVYLPFEGEQHGFRRAETIKRALEAELAFYGDVFGFVPG
jgi:dipeptidyl aminopeptidase/acylaminoacyl peptidase